MTLFEPTLIVTLMVIHRGSHVAYDELFHKVVNIIRGENSSGKSTILNFIFYGLGGDLVDWSDVAKLCTHVYLEVLLNDKPATLLREVSEQHGQPMEVFGGSYIHAIAARRDDWIKYPYRRSESLENFSQALFRLLGIPEVRGDSSANVTFHQYLRLVYADQLSPVESLFRFERFDPPTLRDTIGRLHCGAYDGTLYSNELKLRELQREFDALTVELRSLYAVLGSANSMTPEWLNGERATLAEKRRLLMDRIDAAEKEVYSAAEQDALTLAAQDNEFSRVQSIQQRISQREAEFEGLKLDIADSAHFILSLQAKITALSDANLAASHIGEVDFQVCPACYAPISKPDNASQLTCHLCKSPLDDDAAKGRIVALTNDAAIQLKQSEYLQARRQKDVEKYRDEIAALRKDWSVASERLAELQRLPSSEVRANLRSLHREVGYLDRQSEDLEEKAKLIGQIDNLQQRKDAVNGEITRIRSANERLRSAQDRRLTEAYSVIEEEIRHLLRNDLRRQDSFENAQRVEFDFGANRISVDNHSYFSASSRVILKSSFFLGLFAAANKLSYFRHPRFCMIDTMEDKGMEPVRSHNFQLQVARVSDESRVQHQIIFATAMIVPDLDEETYTIGRFSTRDEPTLNIG
jgi:predicted nuclease with TOPRIM domain